MRVVEVRAAPDKQKMLRWPRLHGQTLVLKCSGGFRANFWGFLGEVTEC